MVNNTKNTTRVEIMARIPKTDQVWNDIFDSLVLDTEPPIEYIKNVIITTKTGVRLKVSALDFAQILERERFINPEESDILSCRLAINFDKVRKDVDEWADQLIYFYDHDGKKKPPVKRTRKPAAKTTKSTAATKAKAAAKTKATKAKATATKKTTTRKPRGTSKKST
jgi:hypothetical protein